MLAYSTKTRRLILTPIDLRATVLRLPDSARRQTSGASAQIRGKYSSSMLVTDGIVFE